MVGERARYTILFSYVEFSITTLKDNEQTLDKQQNNALIDSPEQTLILLANKKTS